jgi:hypothetical protein
LHRVYIILFRNKGLGQVSALRAIGLTMRVVDLSPITLACFLSFLLMRVATNVNT